MPTQRDHMRQLYKDFAGDEKKIVNAYAAAESTNVVVRISNKYKITAIDYAKALYKDGIRKGWIYR